ncbi:fungal-specific transcription factor domain-containing protein [Pyrenochaeta sp. MPI-SDFR-AT-0127]|nr:fungal-specific transcription factor domain-containing protein [Pyrenochaeta sp. MPI-SDFR-AT-0127]
MPSVIGPYDGRKARRKRCDACVKRQIRCHGGIPCDNCRRTNQSCKMTTKNLGSSLVFVRQESNCGTKGTAVTSVGAQVSFPLHSHTNVANADRSVPYFFETFLPMNIFSSKNIPIHGDLLAMSRSSPALRDAIDAVAMLHAQRQSSVPSMGKRGEAKQIVALQAYARSVRCIQEEIAFGTFVDNKSALWVTFLLGLFELMRDSTGTNWLSHFLHGTSTMLRLQRPEDLISQDPQNIQRRSFFLATRIFEISRSLIFSSPTFLSTPDWTVALAKLWEGEGVIIWHPKEALFDILPHFSELSIRTLNFCENFTPSITNAQCAQIRSLADEGLGLQSALQQWCADATTWEINAQSWAAPSAVQNKVDVESLIGYIYYHATNIYLSGTYDYHPHWTQANAPILSRNRIEFHVSEILRLSEELLRQGVAGILLFFPLRVAGARATDDLSRSTILSLLQTIATRGFIVAEPFITELADLWTCKHDAVG